MRNIGVCRDEATSQRNTARPRQAADSTGVVREQEEAACDKHEAYLRELCARSWMAGGFLWHQFDYVLLIVALASIIAAAGVGTFYVQNRLVRRLTSISNALRLLPRLATSTPRSPPSPRATRWARCRAPSKCCTPAKSSGASWSSASAASKWRSGRGHRPLTA